MNSKQEKQDNENYSKNFTRVPNIVFVSYNNLSHEEKFLYCKLRCVYWDAKPRFASLREISRLTSYAISALSRILPRLHKCGLIHAEIKQEVSSDGAKIGKPKYHITIPDIWELNRKYFECSPEERFDPSDVLIENENVLEKNNNVLQKNVNVPDENENVLLEIRKRSSQEQKRDTETSLQARPQAAKDNKDLLKDKEEREKDSPLPLSSQKTEIDYDLFDRLCREKGYAPDFKVPRNERNNAAIQELRSQNATVEQVSFVFNDIWEDKDTFWTQHRGKPSAVASQFTARVWKMSQPSTKRRTASGFANWTDDKSMGVVEKPVEPPQETKPILHIVKPEPQPTYGPKQDQTPKYTRLKIEKPARARTLQGRLQQEKKDSGD